MLPIEIDLSERTAALVIDMQNGFCHPDGALARGGLDIAPLREAVTNSALVVQACRQAGVPVLWSRQEHVEGDVARRRHRLPTHIDKGGYLPCVQGTWDAELVGEVGRLVKDSDLVFTKHRASCFFDTVLDTYLRMHDVTTLIVTGVATNYCVESTIRDAYARDFDLLVVDDACGASVRDLHDATMRNVELFHGQVVTTAEVVAALEGAGTSRRD